MKATKKAVSDHAVAQPMKRKLMSLALLFPWLSACQVGRLNAQTTDATFKNKFRGIGGVTVVVFGSLTEHQFITFTTDSGRSLGAPSRVNQKTIQRSFYDGDSLAVPKTVRVIWKEGDVKNDFPRGWLGGTVVGDYTTEVAQRIPPELTDDLRRDPKGNLRIKFRLADDGVLFGWDIERRPGYDPKNGVTSVPPVYSFTGGDFQEARLIQGPSGQVSHAKGWYIHPKTKERIETDF